MRRRLFLLIALIAAPVAFSVLPAAPPAQAFCDTSEGCSPCGPQLVIDGKNTRLETVYC